MGVFSPCYYQIDFIMYHCGISTSKQRLLIQTSKKADCTSTLYVREITAYPEYMVSDNLCRNS